MSATAAIAHRIGTRSHQCDAAASRTIGGVRAFVLLDDIGSSDEVRNWTRNTARRLARTAATTGDAEKALRRVHAAVTAEPGRGDPWAEPPAAVAVVAVVGADGMLQVAWCGDARAYLYDNGRARRLTVDHNVRQELLNAGRTPGRYDRNTVTAYLGDTADKPVIDAVTTPARGRLLLASDGGYEPIEDAHRDIGAYLYGATPAFCARSIVDVATKLADPQHTDNATVLVADLTQEQQ